MLETLEIIGFQRHKHLSLQLDQITSLIGKSDVGKSSVIRALRWCCLNKPPKGDYVHWGAGFAKVRLAVDGRTVVRSRGKHNLYLLDGRRYEAFGSDVPADIAKLLNVGPTAFAGQHDPSFWLSLTAGQVSRELNSIINLGAIDTALANAASFVRAARAAETVAMTRLDEAKQRAEALSWVPELDKRLAEVEALETRLAETRAKRARIASALAGVSGAKEVLLNAARAKKPLLLAIETADRLFAVLERRERLAKFMREHREGQERYYEVKRQAAEAAAELERALAGGCPVCLRPMPQKTSKKKSF